MKRANPAELRKSLEAAQALAKSGVSFVPMPVLSADDRSALAAQMIARLEQPERQAEAAEVTQ